MLYPIDDTNFCYLMYFSQKNLLASGVSMTDQRIPSRSLTHSRYVLPDRFPQSCVLCVVYLPLLDVDVWVPLLSPSFFYCLSRIKYYATS